MSREEIERHQSGLGDLTEPIKRERGEVIPPVGTYNQKLLPPDLRRPGPFSPAPIMPRQQLGDVIPQTYPVYETLPANGLVLNDGTSSSFSYAFFEDPPTKQLLFSYTVPSGRVLRLTGFQVNIVSGLYEEDAETPVAIGAPNELFYITLATSANVELTNQNIPLEPLDGYYESFLMVNSNETLRIYGNFSNYPIFAPVEVTGGVSFNYVARIRGHLLQLNNLPYQYSTLLGREK